MTSHADHGMNNPIIAAAIASYSDHGTQKILRLISGTFEYALSPFVFEEIDVAPLRHCVSKFTELAQSKKNVYVKRLTFSNAVLPDLSRDDFKAELHPVYSKTLQRRAVDEDISKRYLKYREYLAEQRSWRHGIDDKNFANAFSKLSRIREVVYSDWNDKSPAWTRIKKESGLLAWFDTPGPVRTYVSAGSQLCLLAALGHRNRCTLVGFNSFPPLTKLDMQIHCHELFIHLRHMIHSGEPIQRPPYRLAAKAFSTLTELSLLINVYWDTTRDPHQLMARRLNNMLLSTRHLRSLTIFTYLPSPIEDSLGSLEIPILVGHRYAKWRALQRLALTNMDISARKLVRLLKHSSKTLKSLSLQHIWLRDVVLLLRWIHSHLRLDEIDLAYLNHTELGLKLPERDPPIRCDDALFFTEEHMPPEVRAYLLNETEDEPDFVPSECSDCDKALLECSC